MSSPPHPPTIGRYRILDEIGRGAMGRVYRAHDPHTDRTVALKILDVVDDRPPEQAAEVRARFLREARAAGRLAHPGIVAVYDADVDATSGTPFLAMELVAGRSLAERIEERGPLPWSSAAAIAASVADALDHAHERGVVHRDLKPANVLLADGGAVKVSDFGVARLVDESSTVTGTLRGTPSYMAPEQIRGGEVDGRADLYALGTVLYEMLTGEPPFQADTVVGVAHQAVHDDPRPPSFACPDLPLELERVVLRAMAKEPAERYASGREMAAALRAAAAPEAAPPAGEVATVVLPRPASPAMPAPAPSRHPGARSALGLAALAAVLAGALAAGLWLRRPRDVSEVAASPPPAATHPLPAAAAPVPPPVAAPVDDVTPAGAKASTGEAPPAAPVAAATAAEEAPPDRPEPESPAQEKPAPRTVAPAAPAPAPPIVAPAEPPAPADAAPADASAPLAAAPSSTIEIHFVNRIKAGSLEVWIDGERAWSTPLESPRNPLRRIGGEELIGSIAVAAGLREIEVRVANASERIDARGTVSAELPAGGTRLLRVVLVPLRSKLRLKWEP